MRMTFGEYHYAKEHRPEFLTKFNWIYCIAEGVHSLLVDYHFNKTYISTYSGMLFL